ncbi:MAG: hypothetical protein AB1791_06605 [Chloroflexota bacterium]
MTTLQGVYPSSMNLPDLRQLLTDSLDLEDVRTLCFDLGIDYDSLRGEGKAAKVRELIVFCAGRRRIAELEGRVQRLHPHLFNQSLMKPETLPFPVMDKAVSTEISPTEIQLGGVQVAIETNGDLWLLRVCNTTNHTLRQVNVILRPPPTITVHPVSFELGLLGPGAPAETRHLMVRLGSSNSETSRSAHELGIEAIYRVNNETQPTRVKQIVHIEG